MTRHKWDLLTDTCDKCGCIRQILPKAYKGFVVTMGNMTYKYSYDNGKTYEENRGCKPYKSTEDIIERGIVTPI